MNNRPLVSIIILNYNGIKDTVECLDSLKYTTYDNYEIIVVDNASSDNSREMLRRREGIRFIELDKNCGFAEGNNVGLEHSKGSLICLLNNDTVVDPHWLSGLADTLLNDERIAAVYPFFIDYGVPKEKMWPVPSLVQTLKNGTYNLIGYPIYDVFDDYILTYLNASGCCLLFRKEIFDTYCDNDYFLYYDDVYFCWRIKLHNYEIKRSPYAVVYHKGSATMEKKQQRGRGIYLCERNRLMTLLIFYNNKTLFKVLPLLFIDEIKKIALVIIRLFFAPGYTFAILKARFWLLFNIIRIFKKRQLIQKERKVSDEDIIKGLSFKITNQKNVPAIVLNRMYFLYAKLLNLKTYETLKS